MTQQRGLGEVLLMSSGTGSILRAPSAKRPRGVVAFHACLAGCLLPIALFVSHEMSHLLVAKAFGWRAQLHWGWVSIGEAEHEAIWGVLDGEEASAVIRQSTDGYALTDRWKLAAYCLSGPAQTVIFGAVGALWLALRRRRRPDTEFMSLDWLLLSLAMFLGRQPLVLVETLAADYLGYPTSVFGDEVTAAVLLDVPRYGLILLLTAVALPFLTCLLAPLRQALASRLIAVAFLLCVVLGGVLWVSYLGPTLLP